MLSWDGHTVLVAGGAGFIGSALARSLVRAGARVHVADALVAGSGGNWANLADIADGIEFHHLDLAEAHRLSRVLARCDVVFNLVGRNGHQDSMTTPLDDLAANLTPHLALVDACRRVANPPQTVLASTRQLYGRPERLPVDETHPVRPLDVNGVHRLATEQHHQLYAEVYDIPVSILRLTNCYGPGMALGDLSHGFLSVWLERLIEGRPIEVWGGAQQRDLLHVDDAVDALMHAAVIGDDHRGEVFNVGTDDVVTLHDLAALLLELDAGVQPRVIDFPARAQAIDIGSYFTDFAKFGATGWAPRVDLVSGMRRTLAHYRFLREASS